MVNELQAYFDCGKRAGKAMRENDAPRHQEEARYYTRMYNLEKHVDRKAAEQAYKDGYKLTRGI